METKRKESVLLSTAYWPSLEYFYFVLAADKVLIEKKENYEKQTYRNRCRILSANGPLQLIIPVEKTNSTIEDVRISYKENWQHNHWRAIESAYKKSAYFEYFEEEVKRFYTEKTEFLFEYNYNQLKAILNILRLRKEIDFTTEYKKNVEEITDLRDEIHPKKEINKEADQKLTKRYYQVFEQKFGFQKNLSILDLVFHQGLNAIPYLKE